MHVLPFAALNLVEQLLTSVLVILPLLHTAHSFVTNHGDAIKLVQKLQN
jgi:hypothetical protein